jgi:hypothetical protein
MPELLTPTVFLLSLFHRTIDDITRVEPLIVVVEETLVVVVQVVVKD